MSACRSCSAEVLWCFTTKGKRMPVDPEPVADGNVVVTPNSTPGGAPIAAVLAAGTPMPVGVLRYTSHFATCPNADSHRRSH